MKKKDKKQKHQTVQSEMESSYDVLGSYTGSYLSGELEEPVQDVDDL